MLISRHTCIGLIMALAGGLKQKPGILEEYYVDLYPSQLWWFLTQLIIVVAQSQGMPSSPGLLL